MTKEMTISSYWNRRSGISWVLCMVFGPLVLVAPYLIFVFVLAVAYHLYALYQLESNGWHNRKIVRSSIFNLFSP